MKTKDCFFLDNDCQIIPLNLEALTSHISDGEVKPENRDKRLLKLKGKLSALDENMKNIIEMCATSDQTVALSSLIKCITSIQSRDLRFEPPNKRYKSQINSNNSDYLPQIAMVTAGRGRGKSALLGMSIAIAINCGLSRVVVVAPCLDNIGTLMQFALDGLVRFGYVENRDFVKRMQEFDMSRGSGILEIEIVKNRYRQIVRYILPTLVDKVEKVDLLCIDETAAIPLPIVKKFMELKCDIVFLSSTIHGYEGTGRSLSLKLMKQLRERFQKDENKSSYFEINLKEPIRYSNTDNAERWLNNLLCLNCDIDVVDETTSITYHQPAIDDCQLFFVNRDVLFCGSETSERFLQQIMGIYVSSHYKNTPNDLQMLADCASHALFCFAKPVLINDGLPLVCAVIQVAFEGSIDPVVAKTSLEGGVKPSGDMVPWTVIQQFGQYDFAKLTGARIVRIAVHHELQRHGYGSHAVRHLFEHFSQIRTSSTTTYPKTSTVDELVRAVPEFDRLDYPKSLPFEKLGSLFMKVTNMPLISIDYLSVSYGLTSDLLRFWKRNHFVPIYLRQTMNEATGEHSCIMIRQLSQKDTIDSECDWLNLYNNEFRRRFCQLLAGPFKQMDSVTALEFMHRKSFIGEKKFQISSNEIHAFFTKFDIDRIEKYIRSLIDYHAIIDVVHSLAVLGHTRSWDGLKIPKFQQLVLVGLGLQYKSVDELSRELSVAMVTDSTKKVTGAEVLGHLRECVKSMTKFIKPILQ